MDISHINTPAASGSAVLLAIASVVKTPSIVQIAGEYLPVLQSGAATGAIICCCIVIAKEFHSLISKIFK